MKTKVFLLAIVLLSACLFPYKTSANWAYTFVVWNGYTYILQEEVIEHVGDEIGEVTFYSDIEGTYSGNFSNAYEKGTKYFSILGVSTDEAIAVQEKDGTFTKAKRSGEYAGGKYSMTTLIIGSLGLIVFVSLITYKLERYIRRERAAR
ncbi:hypothetical protein KUV80_13130 [Fictibacillus nanhaiensis]|uniref:hypothetical protein n=1 Tax=Fictibacillus nanhaiensis TaxID=742169 RepID=UPI001C977A83|nr:hypothetical protein [Fictibacillus nanhaiensis]MBY6037607.1 hypothetical protein [Fictibacillus nanhaiensis]